VCFQYKQGLEAFPLKKKSLGEQIPNLFGSFPPTLTGGSLRQRQSAASNVGQLLGPFSQPLRVRSLRVRKSPIKFSVFFFCKISENVCNLLNSYLSIGNLK
jgi:hypothetical protein